MNIMTPLKIKKEKLMVVILTRDYRVRGEVHVQPASRLTDYVNSKTDANFIAVTNAEIIALSPKVDVSKVDYLAINKSFITMIYPLDSETSHTL